jgi:hypothetical protein
VKSLFVILWKKTRFVRDHQLAAVKFAFVTL